MRVAVVGSRGLYIDNLGEYLPSGVTEIISGGARGIDTLAKDYALLHGLKVTEYLPEYSRYGKAAPLRRNIKIIENADLVLAFWDGESAGTKYVIENCKKRNIPIEIHMFKEQNRTPHHQTAPENTAADVALQSAKQLSSPGGKSKRGRQSGSGGL